MSWISEEDIKAIRQQADIVDVMSHYITLEKQGKNYKAICPFHDDHDQAYRFRQINKYSNVLCVAQEEMYLLLFKKSKIFLF